MEGWAVNPRTSVTAGSRSAAATRAFKFSIFPSSRDNNMRVPGVSLELTITSFARDIQKGVKSGLTKTTPRLACAAGRSRRRRLAEKEHNSQHTPTPLPPGITTCT